MDAIARFLESLSPSASAALAAIAAVISALGTLMSVALIGWTGRRTTHPIIKVSTTVVVPVRSGVLGAPLFAIVVRNRGVLPVTFTSATLRTASGQTVMLTNPQSADESPALPKRLEGGDAFDIAEDMRTVAELHASDAGPISHVVVSSAAHGDYSARVKRQWLASWKEHAAAERNRL